MFRCMECLGSFVGREVIQIEDYLSMHGKMKRYVCKKCFKTFNKPAKVDVSKFVARKRKMDIRREKYIKQKRESYREQLRSQKNGVQRKKDLLRQKS